MGMEGQYELFSEEIKKVVYQWRWLINDSGGSGGLLVAARVSAVGVVLAVVAAVVKRSQFSLKLGMWQRRWLFSGSGGRGGFLVTAAVAAVAAVAVAVVIVAAAVVAVAAAVVAVVAAAVVRKSLIGFHIMSAFKFVGGIANSKITTFWWKWKRKQRKRRKRLKRALN